MKIKRWLIISYILVILSPILTGTVLFRWIRNYNQDIQLKDYLDNMERFGRYEVQLDDPDLYLNPPSEYKILSQEEKKNTEIKLYDSNGYNLYTSGIESMSFSLNKETLYKDLYEVKRGYKTESLKKPVFKDSEMVGLYQVTLTRNDLIRGINTRYIIALTIFGLHFLLVIFLVIKMINKKINNPLKLLIGSMEKFAEGENIQIEYGSEDEIGELIDQFNSMKDEIEEKNLNLEKEKASKEYMISAISHDLKTPLTSIRAYTEILKNEDEKAGDPVEEYKDIIISKCDYMKDMLEDLYLYTLLTSDYSMEFVEVEGLEFFQMLFSGYGEVCTKNKLEYTSQIRAEGEYTVDVKSMMRVMDNLITNAVKYSSKGSEIFVGAYSKEFDLPERLGKDLKREVNEFRQESTVVIVQNRANNISKDEIGKIFEPFYKTDSSRNNMQKNGTGLGLSIVKMIVEKHGGNIEVISENNRITVVFTIN